MRTCLRGRKTALFCCTVCPYLFKHIHLLHVWVFVWVDLRVSVSRFSLLMLVCALVCMYILREQTHTHTYKPQGFGVPCVHVNVTEINGSQSAC